MHKLILSGAMAAGMLMGMGSAVSADTLMMGPHNAMQICQERTLWSDATCDCVIDRAADQLTLGQVALLLTYRDGAFNSLSTAREYDLNLIERAEVRAFARVAAPVCALG